MTPLPAWIEAVAKESGASRADHTPRLIQAVSILWEAAEHIQNCFDMEGCCPDLKAKEAMRRIAEVGK